MQTSNKNTEMLAPLTRAKVRNIAVAFEELSKDENGVAIPKECRITNVIL